MVSDGISFPWNGLGRCTVRVMPLDMNKAFDDGNINSFNQRARRPLGEVQRIEFSGSPDGTLANRRVQSYSKPTFVYDIHEP